MDLGPKNLQISLKINELIMLYKIRKAIFLI